MTSAVLTDTLPANLTFVSASVDSIGAGLSVGSSTVTNTGQTVTYDFQNIVRTSVDGIFNADDQIRVLLTAVVNTDPANVAGTEITNTSTLNVNPVGAPPLNPSTATADIDVVFPELVADKTGTIALAPGDTASYTATFTNTGTAPAYDAFIEDTLGDPFLSLNTGTVTAVLNGVDVTADLTINETATGFDFVLFDTTNGVPLPILPGESLVVSYDATLSASAPDANSFPNTISADFDTVGDGDPASPGSLRSRRFRRHSRRPTARQDPRRSNWRSARRSHTATTFSSPRSTSTAWSSATCFLRA
jgi:fimbrial isopeptide formation D2 family protein